MSGLESDSRYGLINFEETELRLGLPGGGGGGGGGGGVGVGVGGGGGGEGEVLKNNGKRGFIETVDLKLNLSSKVSALKDDNSDKSNLSKPPAKAQVVGWPPVKSVRKNIMTPKAAVEGEERGGGSGGGGAFVKVSMDGAPYLRKVDLKFYKTYQELSLALTKMFSSFSSGNLESEGVKDLSKESKLGDGLNGSDYVPTYEDKDGDWMLVGDVPWEMFVNSCKRLRIMKGVEAIGLEEKCKSRSQ